LEGEGEESDGGGEKKKKKRKKRRRDDGPEELDEEDYQLLAEAVRMLITYDCFAWGAHHSIVALISELLSTGLACLFAFFARC
jgi:hypothetical protein